MREDKDYCTGGCLTGAVTGDYALFNDGERQIGRVYKLPSIEEQWKWAMTASIGNRLGSTAGIEDTRDEACDAVESAYEAMKAAIPIRLSD